MATNIKLYSQGNKQVLASQLQVFKKVRKVSVNSNPQVLDFVIITALDQLVPSVGFKPTFFVFCEYFQCHFTGYCMEYHMQ